MTETIEKHYIEQTNKIDKLADTIDRLATAVGAAPAASSPGKPNQTDAILEQIELVKKQNTAIAEACELLIAQLEKMTSKDKQILPI